MDKKETVKYIIDKLLDSGSEKASCRLVNSVKNELNVENGNLSLFRTTYNTDIALTAFKNDKKGIASINKEDRESIGRAVRQAIEFAESSEADQANEIAELQEAGTFKAGIESPDLDKMYDRLDEFVKEAKTRYPLLILNEIIFDFTGSSSYFMNSNGVDYYSEKGIYNFEVEFTSKEGEKSSSFNYSDFSTFSLDKPFLKEGSFDRLFKQSSEQLETKSVTGKFIGDIIVTPDSIEDFTSFITDQIGKYPLITGNSAYKNNLNKHIASEKLTIHSHPHSDQLASGYFITEDGYKAENCTIVEKGVLKTFLLDLYGSRKTGKERAVNSGGCYIIEKGNKPIEEMVKSIEKGLLVCRFSGGEPASNGDFSGVAKNSYYIENGKIQYPISETMISGNVKEMLLNIKEISEERINFGSAVYPWIQFSDITISGK